jgi:hypothetical protein
LTSDFLVSFLEIVMKNMTGEFNAHAPGKVGKGTTDCHCAQCVALICTFPVMLATMLDI